MLPGTINQKGRTEIIYTPLVHLNLSKLSPAVQEHQGYIPAGKSMPDQTKEITPEDRAFEANDKSLEYLEQQLYELSLARRVGKNQTKLIHGSYLGIGIISTGLLIYLIYTRMLKIIIARHLRLILFIMIIIYFVFLSTYHFIYLIDIIIIMDIKLYLGIMLEGKPIDCWTVVKFVQSELRAN